MAAKEATGSGPSGSWRRVEARGQKRAPHLRRRVGRGLDCLVRYGLWERRGQCAGNHRCPRWYGQRGDDRKRWALVEVLREFRDAVSAQMNYDAYGFAQYLPSTQRVAIDAVCFVADQELKGRTGDGVEDPTHLTQTIVRKAEADLKSEHDIVAPRAVRRAIAKLQAILGLDSLNHDLAKSYVRACY